MTLLEAIKIVEESKLPFESILTKAIQVLLQNAKQDLEEDGWSSK